MKNKKQLGELKKLLQYYDFMYYGKNMSVISDFEYDKLKSQYKALGGKDFIGRAQEEFFLIGESQNDTQNGKTHTKNTRIKIPHIKPVLSLDNVYSFEDINNFANRMYKHYQEIEESINFCCQEKIDGLTLVLQYKNGEILSAATRGDGNVGDSVSIEYLHDIPKNIFSNTLCDMLNVSQTSDQIIEIRGEVFMKKVDFIELNSTLSDEEKFSSARHAAAGTLKNLDINQVKNRKLHFVVHGIAMNDDFLNIIKNIEKKLHHITLSFVMQFLTSLGFKTAKTYIATNTQEIQKIYEEILSNRQNIEYDIDGVVIRVDNMHLQEKIGYANTTPKFAVAYKFPAKTAKSQILNITLQVGRTGVITPVAQVQNTIIDGVNITNVSLHNFNDILERDIRIGDAVIIERAGDVIPYIGKVLPRLHDLEKFSIPKECPCCKHDIIQKNALYYCFNSECRDQVILRILHFANGMNIVGLGRKNIEFFYDHGFISNISDIFSLRQYKQEIEIKNNWGTVSIDKLLSEIEKSIQTKFDKFLYSIGLPGIGDFNSKLFAQFFQNFDNFLRYFDVNTSKEEFINACIGIRGIGDTICNDVYDYVLENINELHKLSKIIKCDNDLSCTEGITSNKKLFQKDIVITGKFNNHKRSELEEIIKNNGGIVKNEVTTKTFAVIVGNKPTERKIQQAKQYAILTLSIEEFMNKLVDL